MHTILALVFVLSGAAGLLYESIWSRYLGLFVGHSAYAQVLVLVIFLGGMSVGAGVVARVSRRLTKPLLAYAAVEAIVGLLGFAFHDGYGALTTWAYDALFPAVGSGWLMSVAKWSLGALLILPQSVLLGATFPLMSAGVQRITRPDRAGRALAMLYAANSFGAAIGVLMAGFLFLPLLGLPGTVLAAAVGNLACALAVYVLVRSRRLPEHAAPEAIAPMLPETDRDARSASLPRLRIILLATAFGTAVASFIYEVAWVRMLSLVLGSATHSFELMLSAFILGLAIGAWWIRNRIDGFADRLAMLVRIQIVMAVLAAITVVLYIATFGIMAGILSAVSRTDAGYQAFAALRYALCLLIMLPATICAGMTLPLITRILADAGAGEPAIGEVYAFNTIGSIVGVAMASLVLMPTLGLRLLLLTGAAIDLVWAYLLLVGLPPAGLSADASAGPRRWARRYGPVAAASAVLVGLLLTTRFDPILLASGVFRSGRLNQSASLQSLMYIDGRTASVSVIEGGEATRRKRSVATNGKPDASLTLGWLDTSRVGGGEAMLAEDEATQALLPLLTLAHRPEARRAAVIGQGSGMSSHFLLGSPRIDTLYTIEIEPAMVTASRAFYPANRRVFDDPRSRFVTDDARSVFAGSSRGFDLIMSEPSNPWVSGVSGLFTEEFYGRVRRALVPGGVFGQWMHLYEMTDALVLTVLRALSVHFPVFRIYLTNTMDMLIVASADRTLSDMAWQEVADLPAIQHDLRQFRAISADQIGRSLVATSEELAPLLRAPYGRNSDFFPLLDQGAEQARFLGRAVEGVSGRGGANERFDLYAALGGRRIDAGSPIAGPLLVPRVLQATIAAQVRAGVVPADGDSSTLARASREAHRRIRSFDRELLAAEAPLDWVQWLEAFREAEAIWNGGRTGVADSLIFVRAEAFARRYRAPERVIQSLRFERAAAVWDWPTAIATGRALAEERIRRGRRWIGEDRLRDVLVVALMKSNRLGEAAQFFERLAPFSTRGAEDLRTQLLAAYLTAPPAS